MFSYSRTWLKRTILPVVAAVVLFAAVPVVLHLTASPTEWMDPAAQVGEPQALPEEYGYSHMAPQQVPGAVRLCGAPPVEGKDVFLFLTNPQTNLHQMRAEVYKADPVTDPSTGKVSMKPGKLLGMTGFLEPGTWVEKVTLKRDLPDEAVAVCIKIALRNRETGRSEGYFYLNTTLYGTQ